MGNGSTFKDREDYWDMAELVLATLCMHNVNEVAEFVKLTDPDLHRYALSVSADATDYVCAIALLKPNLFTAALRETSLGCPTTA